MMKNKYGFDINGLGMYAKLFYDSFWLLSELLNLKYEEDYKTLGLWKVIRK